VITFLSYIGLYREHAGWQSTKEIDEIHRTIHIVTHCLGLNLPYCEREIKIEGFGGRPPFGGRPGALGPMGPTLNPALAMKSWHFDLVKFKT